MVRARPETLDELTARLDSPDTGHPGLAGLSGLLAGEPEAARWETHVRQCPACQARLAELQQEARRFLHRQPAGAFIQALREKQQRDGQGRVPAEGPADAWSGWLRAVAHRLAGREGLVGAALAGLLLVLLAGPPGVRPLAGPGAIPARTGPIPDDGSGIRDKGAWSLGFWVSTAGGPRRGEPGGRYRAGTRVQLAPRAPRPAFLVVVSLDSRGAVSVFADRAGQALPIPRGGTLLPESIVLDDAVGPERVNGCFADRAIPTAAVVAAARRALTAAGGDVRAVDALPIACAQAGFTIVKE